jgi:hypothetical protein
VEAAEPRQPGEADVTLHWQSSFGLIVIEVRKGQVFVNGVDDH